MSIFSADYDDLEILWKDDEYVIEYNPILKIITKNIYKNGKFHNDNGPAVTKYKVIGKYRNEVALEKLKNNDFVIIKEQYFIEGKLHREDGFALFNNKYGSLTGEYWYKGKKVFIPDSERGILEIYPMEIPLRDISEKLKMTILKEILRK
jgi:hypothetical protein